MAPIAAIENANSKLVESIQNEAFAFFVGFVYRQPMCGKTRTEIYLTDINRTALL